MEDSRDRVILRVGSNAAHYQQIFTGFETLAKQAVINLQCRFEGRGVVAEIGGQRIYYDVSDGWGIDEGALAVCDSYYKRSYSAYHHRQFPDCDKIKPLGLNYLVYPDFIHRQRLQRDYLYSRSVNHARVSSLHGLRQVVGSLGQRLGGHDSSRHLHSPPSDQSPRVLFLTRTWEPNGKSGNGMPVRQEVNDTRAECIALLRERFGDRCIAGFAPSEHARHTYPDLIANVDTSKRSYLKLLRDRATVCVATTGLHGSIGWKFAEYVAYSKAIVSEPLFYCAPGLSEGQHYVAFSDPGECLEQVDRLLTDPIACLKMRKANQQYYQTFLRPDKLVLRTLEPHLAYGSVNQVRADLGGLQA